MSFFDNATLSWATGGFVGPTLPCQRTKFNQDLEVLVRRSDTGQAVDGIEVDVSGETPQNSGYTGPGSTYFPGIAMGNHTVRVRFLTPADQVRFRVPALSTVRMARNKRKVFVVLLEVVPILALTFSDHHFAPSREQIRIDYDIRGLSHRVVTLTIRPAGSNYRFYEMLLDDGQKADGSHSIAWDGRINRGARNGRYIDPLDAPYRIRILCPEATGGGTASNELFVYYHSIRLEQGTWTPDGQVPNKAANPMRWVQYKLNELGYFAGPVDGVKGAQTSRALRRYTYAAPGDYALQPKEHDAEGHATLDAQLTAGDFRRQIFENGPDRLPGAGEQARAFIEHDYFYGTMAEFVNPIGHLAKDQAKLDPIQFPVEASLRLVSRDDVDGTGAGVDVDPEAIGPLEIEWDVDDPPEDTDVLPPNPPTAAIPSRGRLYVDAVLLATQDAAQRDNCRVEVGGRRAAVHDAGQYFAIGAQHAPWTTTHAGTQVFSTVHQGPAAHANAGKRGRAGAWFRGSYIAGDNFRIRARMAFARHPNAATLAANHIALAGLTGRVPSTITDAESGDFTLWRIHHVAAIVDWPSPGRRVRPDFARVREIYRSAHCELHADDVPRYDAHALFPTGPEQVAFVNAIHAAMPAAPNLAVIQAHAGPGGVAARAFSGYGLYPYPILPHGPATSAATYRGMLRNMVTSFEADAVLEAIASQIREKVAARRPAGAVFLRFHWHPAAFVRCGWRVVGRAKDLFWPYYATTENSCIGLEHGVACLENQMTSAEGAYLFAHEVAHCRFMQHHETDFTHVVSDFPNDHDTADHNCSMSYPDGISSRPGLAWTPGSAEQPRFCGKCILKLRGWDVTAAALPLPAHS